MVGDKMIEEINAYTKWLFNLAKTNPQKARKIALKNLQNLHRTGMCDKDDNLVSH